MQVGINTLLLSSSKAGIGNYIYYLLKHLYQQKGLDLVVFGKKETLPGELSQPNTKAPFFNIERSWQRILWEQLFLPWQSSQVDIMHYPDYAMPVMYKFKPSIITVHDLSFLLYPETFTKGSSLTKQMLSKPSVLKADKIITDSQNTKKDLIKLFGISEEKIAVIYLGFDADSFKPYAKDEARTYLVKKYHLADPYFLYLGTLEPRKNIPTLIRAYSIVKDSLGSSCPKLVLGGGKGWLYDEIFTTIARLGLEQDVIFPGYIPAVDLPYFYNCAEIFIYPSLYEGFGLPPLEAMACGTPVITSNTSSLPEVVGEAGLMINPLDYEELAKLMQEVYINPGLKVRLSKGGLQQAKQFSWDKTAEQTLAVYSEVYQQRGHSR